MFKSKRQKIRDFLKNKEWQTLDEVALGAEMGRGSTKQTLAGMSKEIQTKDDKFMLLPPQEKVVAEKPIEDLPPPTNDISDSVIQQEDGGVSSGGDSGVSDTKDSIQGSSAIPQPKGLNEKINDLNTKLDLAIGLKQKKEKKAKLKKFSIGKVKRFNRGKNRACIVLSRNQGAKLVKGEFLHGMIKVVDKNSVEHLHSADSCFVWLWEMKQPVYIIPEWDIEPLAAARLFSETAEKKTLIDSQRITIRAIELKEQEADEGKKKGLAPMMWIGIAIAGVIIAYIFFGGQKK